MSRTTRGNARRRISYLATSSFIATSILSGASALTAVMTPSVALAAEQAKPSTPPAVMGFDADSAALIP